MIGLTCAACHSGHISYKGVSVRFDGGPGDGGPLKLEQATGLSIAYTLIVPFRFNRFATRVLGPDASAAERAELKKGLTDAAASCWHKRTRYRSLYARGTHQQDTEEGYGRLDALNRIGNQVFYTDMALSGVTVSDKNMHVPRCTGQLPADLDRALVLVGAIRRLDLAAADSQCRRGARRRRAPQPFA